MLKLPNNLVCIKHPHYQGDSNPDLACKTCCAKFVARIRAEQSEKFESTWNTTSLKSNDDFQPLRPSDKQAKTPKRHANFDGSWV